MKKIAYRLLRKVGVLKRVSFNTSITLNNKKFNIPIINEVGLGNFLDSSEPWMLHILNRLIAHPDYQKTFIDVGVNLGQTLIKVKAVAPLVHYIGFEPNPLCVNYINKLVAANKFTNSEIVPVGIGDKSSVLKLKLFNNSDFDSSASIIEGFRNESSITKTINVPVFKYSDLSMEKELNIGIIKVDVEGAELEVIRGFKCKIKSDRPVILIEILPVYNSENLLRISRQENIQKILIELDYKILRVIKVDNRFNKVQEILEFGVHSDLNLCEYVLTPSEQLENIKRALEKF